MRVTSEHLTALKEKIEPLDTPERRVLYIKGAFPNASLTKDLNKRYRWDLFWASGASKLLYDTDYNDSHIDTALRSLVPEIPNVSA
jgi:hypothetical protein